MCKTIFKSINHITILVLVLWGIARSQDLSFVLENGITDGLVQFGGGKSIWTDVNNDDLPDLILSGVVSSTETNLTVVYINNGDDSYTVNQTLPYGCGYFGDIDAGDVDNDGDIDLIISGGGTTSLLLNDGSQFTFDPLNLFPGLLYSSSSLGDIDNDGDLDLILMGLQYPEVKLFTRIYMNDPLGTFTADETQILAPLLAGDADFGDYDGDGDLDLAIGGQSAETTSRVMKIYKNEPTGRLIEDTNQSLTGLKASSIEWADIDNDGDLDLLTTGWDGDKGGIPVTIFYRNEPAGTLEAYNSGILFGTCYGSLSSGDLDGDGDLDLLISGADSVDAEAEEYLRLKAELFVNDGTGNFTDGGSFDNILHSSIGEFNHDGKPEIFINGFTNVDSLNLGFSAFYENNITGIINKPDPPANLSSFAVSNRIILSWNEGEDAETPVEGLSYTLRMGTSSQGHDIFSGIVSLGSTNIGHRMNKIFTEKSHVSYYWSVRREDQQLQTSDWSLEDTLVVTRLVESIQSLSGVRYNTGAWIDYNGDDRLDLALTGYSSVLKDTSMFLFQNDISGFLTQNVGHNIKSAFGATMAWGDYNNDGYLDFVLSGFSGGGPATYLYRWDADLQTFILVSDSGLPDIWGGRQLAQWGDYNLDGRLDLLIGGLNSNGEWELSIYKNGVDHLFTKDSLQNIEPLISIALAFSDYNKDGYLDFAAGGVDTLGNSILMFYRSDSTGIFVLYDSLLEEGPGVGAMDWGDYNSDGYPDLAIAGLYNTGLGLKIFKNIDGRFLTTEVIDLEGGFYFGSLDWGDYDNDGDLDLVSSGHTTVTLDTDSAGADPITRVWINNEGIFSTFVSLEGAGNGTVRWGDYDNDGDLDLLVAGHGVEGNDFTKVYDNLEGVLNQNEPPEAPFGLIDQVNLDSVAISWLPGLDNINPLGAKTLSEALSYSLLVYHEEQQELVLSGSIP
ncbi:MAG: VCBS repeat-containing protein, partial [Anaerolineales bacterium]